MEIPLGWYSCGDGLYNPQNRVVYSHNMTFLRNAGIDIHSVKLLNKGQLGDIERVRYLDASLYSEVV